MSEQAETPVEAPVEAPVQLPQEHINPLLKKVAIPGETFRLPSGGLFYTNSELADNVKNGEVMVNPMTAMDELLLKSPDKLLSGQSVTDVLTNCLPDLQKPGELLAKDVDYLLMCLRLVSYGQNIDLTAQHSCNEAKDHSYAVPLRPLIVAAKPIDPVALKNYNVTLTNGQVVVLHPPKFMATIKVYQMFSNAEEEIDTEVLGVQLIETIGDMVSSVDGHENKEDIVEWLKKVRVGDVQMISDKVAELSDWGADPTTTVECKDCGKDMEIVVPVNPVSFFT